MINRNQMVEDAKALGLRVEVTDKGRVRIDGRDGDVRKVFVAQGLDTRRDGPHAVSFWDGDKCEGNLSHDDDGYGYGITYESGE